MYLLFFSMRLAILQYYLTSERLVENGSNASLNCVLIECAGKQLSCSDAGSVLML